MPSVFTYFLWTINLIYFLHYGVRNLIPNERPPIPLGLYIKWKDIDGLKNDLNIEHIPSKWRIFILI